MKKSLLLRFGFCFGLIGFCLYSYLDMQNELTELKIKMPEVDQEFRLVREENRRLSYEIDQFQSPSAASRGSGNSRQGSQSRVCSYPSQELLAIDGRFDCIGHRPGSDRRVRGDFAAAHGSRAGERAARRQATHPLADKSGDNLAQ